MKRLAILVLLLAIFSLILLAGCIETKATFTFHDDGTYDSKVVFKTDKIMGGDELTFLGWQIEYIFPFLMTEYEHTVQTTKADYSEYLEHIFTANGLDIETFNTRPNYQFIQKDDGTYTFESIIPQLIDKVTEESKDNKVIEIEVFMPVPIDMANTTNVVNNKATWVLTQADFTHENKLRIITQ
jgi:hypothetical protein